MYASSAKQDGLDFFQKCRRSGEAITACFIQRYYSSVIHGFPDIQPIFHNAASQNTSCASHAQRPVRWPNPSSLLMTSIYRSFRNKNRSPPNLDQVRSGLIDPAVRSRFYFPSNARLNFYQPLKLTAVLNNLKITSLIWDLLLLILPRDHLNLRSLSFWVSTLLMSVCRDTTWKYLVPLQYWIFGYRRILNLPPWLQPLMWVAKHSWCLTLLQLHSWMPPF